MLDSRKNGILNLLLKNNDFLTIEELAEKLKVSKRTIRYDIDEIDDWLAQNKLQVLVKVPRKGISIRLAEHEKNSLMQMLTFVWNDHIRQFMMHSFAFSTS